MFLYCTAFLSTVILRRLRSKDRWKGEDVIHLRRIVFHSVTEEGKQMSFNWSERVISLLGIKQSKRLRWDKRCCRAVGSGKTINTMSQPAAVGKEFIFTFFPTGYKSTSIMCMFFHFKELQKWKGHSSWNLFRRTLEDLVVNFPKCFPTKPTVLSGCLIFITTSPRVDIPRQTMTTSKPSALQDVPITAYKSASP